MKKNKEKIVAVIPVKFKSERVPSKNFREFINGKSLFDLLLEKLLKVENISKIYVSSNSYEIKNKVENAGCTFLPREERFCNNIVSWSDVIYNVVKSIPEKNDVSIAWCHTTSPLFESYQPAIDSYLNALMNKKADGLITVIECIDFLVSEKKQPLNYSWGSWHKYSQYLDKIYSITGALFLAKKEEMLLNRYVISRNPKFFMVPKIESIDVDTPYDFELAKILIQNKNILLDNV